MDLQDWVENADFTGIAVDMGFDPKIDTMFPLYIDKYIELVDLRARFNNLLEDNETNNALILAQEQKISELRVELEDIQAKEPPDCEIIHSLDTLKIENK